MPLSLITTCPDAMPQARSQPAVLFSLENKETEFETEETMERAQVRSSNRRDGFREGDSNAFSASSVCGARLTLKQEIH